MTSAELLDKGMRCFREHLGVVDAELRRSRLRQENHEILELRNRRTVARKSACKRKRFTEWCTEKFIEAVAKCIGPDNGGHWEIISEG